MPNKFLKTYKSCLINKSVTNHDGYMQLGCFTFSRTHETLYRTYVSYYHSLKQPLGQVVFQHFSNL